MSPDKMRVAIAKECRWKEAFPKSGSPHKETERGGLLLPYHWVNEITHERRMDLPDYPNDLNACHEMEKTLNRHECSVYYRHLGEMFPRDEDGDTTGWEGRFSRAIHATAAQRAKAFCRTKGIYHD